MFVKVPSFNIGFLKTEEDISNLLLEKERQTYHFERVRTVEAPIAEFRQLVQTIMREPFKQIRRKDASARLYQNEIFSAYITHTFFSVMVYYICLQCQYEEDKRLYLKFLSYESDVSTGFTEIMIDYNDESEKINIKVVKSGYVNPNEYGFLLQYIFTPTFFQKQFEPFIDDYIANII